ncbi:hypothetical protein [Flavobacterium akiainvivens]|nr:hypothetical protein [Flavobacterium akiainvivens]
MKKSATLHKGLTEHEKSLALKNNIINGIQIIAAGLVVITIFVLA